MNSILLFLAGAMFGSCAICGVQRYVQRILDWRVSAVWAALSLALGVYVAWR
jgi:hypothetical protein